MIGRANPLWNGYWVYHTLGNNKMSTQLQNVIHGSISCVCRHFSSAFLYIGERFRNLFLCHCTTHLRSDWNDWLKSNHAPRTVVVGIWYSYKRANKPSPINTQKYQKYISYFKPTLNLANYFDFTGVIFVDQLKISQHWFIWGFSVEPAAKRYLKQWPLIH